MQNNQLCQTRASHNGQHGETSPQGYQHIAAKGYPHGQGQLIEDRVNAHLESIRALSDETILHNSSRSRTRLVNARISFLTDRMLTMSRLANDVEKRN